MPKVDADSSSIDWNETIVSIIEKEKDVKEESESLQVKKLRKRVLKSLDLEDADKDGKKKFKKAMKHLEEEGILAIDSEGAISLLKSKKRKKDKKEKKEKKKRKLEANESDDDKQSGDVKNNIQEEEAEEQETKKATKGVPCKGNPQGVTRLFLGNLPFKLDETELGKFLPDTVTHIKWITDKETGKFYGSAFIEMDTPTSAAAAVAMAGKKLMNRPVKINFAPARPGDTWPPEKKVIKGGGAGGGGHSSTTGGQAGGSGVKAMGPKPDNCVKLFIGNLSYEIDDDGIIKFFDNVGAEVKAVRWLHHKENGDFKGVGFVEFWNSEACDKAATLNGKNLLGRPIRIDWTE